MTIFHTLSISRSRNWQSRNHLSVTKNCGTLLRESELRRLDGVKRASDDNLPQILVTLKSLHQRFDGSASQIKVWRY